jgi:hypothetical protein
MAPSKLFGGDKSTRFSIRVNRTILCGSPEMVATLVLKGGTTGIPVCHADLALAARRAGR